MTINEIDPLKSCFLRYFLILCSNGPDKSKDLVFNSKYLELNDFITESCDEYERKIISLINQDECICAKDLIKQKINNPEILSVKNFVKDFEQALLKCFS